MHGVINSLSKLTNTLGKKNENFKLTSRINFRSKTTCF